LSNLILKKGVDVNTVNEKNENCLHYAAYCGNFAAAKFLIEHGIQVNLMSKDMATPVALAGFCNELSLKYFKLLELIISSGGLRTEKQRHNAALEC